MLIVIVRWIERKESYGVVACELAKNVIAADLPASIGWNQSASLYPQYFHAGTAVRFYSAPAVAAWIASTSAPISLPSVPLSLYGLEGCNR
jgi:hypothetical protein